MKYSELKAIIENTETLAARKVEVLSSKGKTIPIKKYKDEWDVDKHDVCDPQKRPDKTQSYNYENEDGTSRTGTKNVPVNRVPVPMQKNIVGKAVAFLFGNKVQITAQTKTDQEKSVLAALTRILDDNKNDSQNRVVAKNLFRSTQVAEVWYADKVQEHEDYGFPCTLKIRMAIFTPWLGDELYPYFDDRGNMIAFSRKYTVLDGDNNQVIHFETYTEDKYKVWAQKQSGWEEITNEDNLIKRIPVVFAEQDETEWHDVQRAITRLENIISSHGDTNDYNGSPMIVSEGEIEDFPAKGEPGKMLQVQVGGKVYYLNWDQAPESIKMEIDNLFKVIHAYTQTPDISFENVKGIGAISGIALQFLFMDAHLKVLDKREIFDPYLKRRINILKAFIGYISTGLKKASSQLIVNTEIIPYTIDDLETFVNTLLAANGGEPIISQKASVDKANLVANTNDDYEQIQKETKERTAVDQFKI